MFPTSRQSPPDDERQPPVGRRRFLIRVALWGAFLTVAGAAYLGVLVYTTPDVAELRRAQHLRPSVILSSDGEVIGRFSTVYQAPLTLRQVPPDLINALIATEDHRFYTHRGVDPTRIAGSVWDILHGRLAGGSTLTQQLARNLFPQEIGKEVSLNRKLREAITAFRIERTSTKDEILENYLNIAPFLYNVRGFEMAARTYFGKPAAELDTEQCATLVGMLKGTQRYNPVRNPERARDRRNLVMSQMVRRGTLTPQRYAQLRQLPLVLSFMRPEDGDIGQARHFVAAVREQLVEWADAHDINLDSDGLVISTTLDAKLQRLAQNAVVHQTALLQRVAGEEWSASRLRVASVREARAKPGARLESPPAFAWFWHEHPDLLRELLRQSPAYQRAVKAGQDDAHALALAQADAASVDELREEKTRLSAGFLAMEPATGAVRAWVGSPDFSREQFDHVAQARRQPGSTFKPFVYGAAIQAGMSTEHAYPDTAVDIALPNGSHWRPADGEAPSGEMLTLREGLVHSKNTITAQLMQDVGVDAVINFARAAGVREAKLDAVPSLALGTSPVSLLELGDAYATLAALGERRPPLMITRIADRDGKVLESFESAPERVIETSVAEKLVDMMRGVTETGTGTAIRSEWGVKGDLAAKTGTTQNNTDGWFMLMNPGLVVGAWVGFDDPRVTIRSNYWGQGGHNAVRLVGAFMQQAQASGLIDAKARFPDVAPDPPDLPETPGDSSPAIPDGELAPALAPEASIDRDAPAAAGLPRVPVAPAAFDPAAAKRQLDQALGR